MRTLSYPAPGRNYRLCACVWFSLWLGQTAIAEPTPFRSSLAYHDKQGRLVLHPTPEGHRIPDFSYAGYQQGNRPPPDVPVVQTLSPLPGDNTEHLQQAIHAMGQRPLDANGHRGTLLLAPGTFRIRQTVYQPYDGVVLRGSGHEGDTATVLLDTSGQLSAVLVVGSNVRNRWGEAAPGTTQPVVSPRVPAGSRTFSVADASAFSVGDCLVLHHPSTAAWLEAVRFGETAGDPPWAPGEIDLVFLRTLTRIEGNTIQVDAPIPHDLDRSLSESIVYRYTGESVRRECGVEQLRIEIERPADGSAPKTTTALRLTGVTDSWVRHVTVTHFSKSGILLQQANRVSVLNCRSFDPLSPIKGGKRYNFNVDNPANHILFKHCDGRNGRHTFVTNGGAAVSDVVFTQCTSSLDYSASENHRRWGSAFLWDQITFTRPKTRLLLGMYTRGNWGTGHGWTGTYQVAWNVSTPANGVIINQHPPIGQNFAIGCQAQVLSKGSFGSNIQGWTEGTGKTPVIPSLYEAQLQDRLTFGPRPDAPSDLKAIAKGNAIELTWRLEDLEIQHLRLERASGNADASFVSIAVLEGQQQTCTDAPSTPGPHRYRLIAVSPGGTTAISAVCQIP